jgi:hypothetical protein
MRVLLTDRFCDRAKSLGAQTDYFDENVSGLALRVTAGGVKTWTLHFGPAKKRARIGLGRCPSTSLASARALALEAKSAVAEGRDPRTGTTDAMTVTGLVESYVEKHVAGLRSADEIKRRLYRNIVPVIGNVKLSELHRRDATRVIDKVDAVEGNYLLRYSRTADRSVDDPSDSDLLFPSVSWHKDVDLFAG